MMSLRQTCRQLVCQLRNGMKLYSTGRCVCTNGVGVVVDQRQQSECPVNRASAAGNFP